MTGNEEFPIERGDILSGRPLFSNNPSDKDKKISDNRHFVIVLQVETLPNGTVRALTVPISKSYQTQNDKWSIPFPAEAMKNTPIHHPDSRFCCHSPNIINLYNPDNGLVKNNHPRGNQNRLKHGEVADKKLIRDLLQTTMNYQRQYKKDVPILGASLETAKKPPMKTPHDMKVAIKDCVAREKVKSMPSRSKLEITLSAVSAQTLKNIQDKKTTIRRE